MQFVIDFFKKMLEYICKSCDSYSLIITVMLFMESGQKRLRIVRVIKCQKKSWSLNARPKI